MTAWIDKGYDGFNDDLLGDANHDLLDEFNDDVLRAARQMSHFLDRMQSTRNLTQVMAMLRLGIF